MERRESEFSVAHRDPSVLRGHPVLLRGKTRRNAYHRSAGGLAGLARQRASCVDIVAGAAKGVVNTHRGSVCSIFSVQHADRLDDSLECLAHSV